MTRWSIRRALDQDRGAIVRIWHQGWHDAHRHLVPSEILPYREPRHFDLWLDECIDETVVAVELGQLAGLYSTSSAELSKIYVSRGARGSGLAPILLAHAEGTLARKGIAVAELFCTDGNQRAQRFYERHGWRMDGTFMDRLWLPDGESSGRHVATRRYIKPLDDRSAEPD